MFIIYNEATNKIFSVSDRNDTVVPEGFLVAEKEGSIVGYNFPAHPCDCFFTNNEFVVNEQKMQDRETALAQAQEEAENEAQIQAKIREMAIAEIAKEE